MKKKEIIQEADAPNHSPEIQFQSINIFAKTYFYIITLIKRVKHYLLYENKMFIILKTLFHFIEGCFVPTRLKMVHGFLK